MILPKEIELLHDHVSLIPKADSSSTPFALEFVEVTPTCTLWLTIARIPITVETIFRYHVK